MTSPSDFQKARNFFEQQPTPPAVGGPAAGAKPSAKSTAKDKSAPAVNLAQSALTQTGTEQNARPNSFRAERKGNPQDAAAEAVAAPVIKKAPAVPDKVRRDSSPERETRETPALPPKKARSPASSSASSGIGQSTGTEQKVTARTAPPLPTKPAPASPRSNSGSKSASPTQSPRPMDVSGSPTQSPRPMDVSGSPTQSPRPMDVSPRDQPKSKYGQIPKNLLDQTLSDHEISDEAVDEADYKLGRLLEGYVGGHKSGAEEAVPRNAEDELELVTVVDSSKLSQRDQKINQLKTEIKALMKEGIIVDTQLKQLEKAKALAGLKKSKEIKDSKNIINSKMDKINQEISKKTEELTRLLRGSDSLDSESGLQGYGGLSGYSTGDSDISSGYDRFDGKSGFKPEDEDKIQY